MRMNRKTALAAGALLGMAFLAACSDSPTEPSTTAVYIPKSSFVVAGGVETNSTPEVGKVKVCKVGNIGGSFDVSRTAVGASTGTVSGDNTLIAAGKCWLVAEDNGPSGIGSNVVITEDAAPNVTSSVTGCVFIGGEPAVIDPNPCEFNPANRFINSFHGYVVTYTNTFTPTPETCDFSTFGGFTNNISYGGNAGRIEDPPGFAYGSLNFKNHTNGDHIHVWNVTDYGHPDTGPLSQFEDSRLAFGKGSVNGGPEEVDVEFRFYDAGEPAKKLGDVVYLKVGGVVLIDETVVEGGNIQLHAKKCKKAPKAEKH